MSRLEELIQELCPDGVEYKKLGDVAEISRGGNFQKRILGRKDFLVSIMDRFIRNWDCLCMLL